MAQKIIDEGLSVRQVEALIRRQNDKKKTKQKKEVQQNPYINDIKEKLESYLGTKVQLSTNKKNKGKIEIEYYSAEDLNRILELLNIEI